MHTHAREREKERIDTRLAFSSRIPCHPRYPTFSLIEHLATLLNNKGGRKNEARRGVTQYQHLPFLVLLCFVFFLFYALPRVYYAYFILLLFPLKLCNPVMTYCLPSESG